MTTEFVITVLFVVLPLMILLPTLGKYLDAKHKVEVGARYAAWERTAWFPSERTGGFGAVKNRNVIRDEVQYRVFNRREAPVYTGQAGDDPDLDPLLMYAYADYSEYGPVLEERDSDNNSTRHVATEVDGTQTPGIGGDVEDAFRIVSNLPVGGNFDVGAHSGSHEGRVTVSLRTPGGIDEFENLDLDLSRHNMLVADGWNVGGPEHNERRVKGLVPTSIMDNDIVDAITTGAASGLSFFYPPAEILDDYEPGHVDVEPVPEQYLENK
ncbi:hypothetical protein [Vreelandella utahensis]|uniref:hypothetical protein n=1 Tax=Vreelandella halophila TaxID=86177 RepID=UPI001C4E1B22|nr:hypothetical protein [Halomonas utahensis]